MQCIPCSLGTQIKSWSRPIGSTGKAQVPVVWHHGSWYPCQQILGDDPQLKRPLGTQEMWETGESTLACQPCADPEKQQGFDEKQALEERSETAELCQGGRGKQWTAATLSCGKVLNCEKLPPREQSVNER